MTAKAYDRIVDLLRDHGVENVFGFSSEDNMRLVARVHEQPDEDLRFVKARHEQGAVAMADGYARARGTTAVCTVGRGPAVAQTGNALVTARERGSSLLLLVPEPPLADEFHFKGFDQEGFLRATIGTVVSARSGETLLPELREAFRRVRVGDGPIAVQVPMDVLDGDLPADDGPDHRVRRGLDSPGRPRRPDSDLVVAAVDEFLDSPATEPPVVLAGRGAVRADAHDAITELAERTGALLVTTLQARGYFDDDPYSLGFSGGYGSDLANEYLSRAGFVLAVGCSLNPFTVDYGRLLDDEATIVHVDDDRRSIGRHTPVDLGIAGDARLTVEVIHEELERRGIDRSDATRTEAVRAEIADASTLDEGEFPERTGRVDPRDLVRRLNRDLPEDRVLVLDAGHFSTWVLDEVTAPTPEDVIWSADFASVGLGVPMGVGAALGVQSRPCVTFCGDAGFMMSLQEVDTAVRNGIPAIIVVMNDEGLGAEYHKLLHAAVPEESQVYDSPNLAGLAEEMGAEGHTIRSVDDLDVVREVTGAELDGPVVLDCRINREVRHRSREVFH